MNSNNFNDKTDILREILLQKFDIFLEYIEEILGEKLPDATKMKNISNYILILNGKLEKSIIKSLLKKYDVVKVAKVGFIENAVRENITKIKSAEIYLIPDYTRDLDLETVIFVKKKDKIDNLKEGIKDFLESFLPKPEVGLHYKK